MKLTQRFPEVIVHILARRVCVGSSVASEKGDVSKIEIVCVK